MVKYIAGLVLILFFSSNLIQAQDYRKVILVSDLDDTFKVTHEKNIFRMLYNLFHTQETYDSMVSLYQCMKEGGAELYFLTNQNIFIRRNTKKLLKDAGLESDTIFFRGLLQGGGNHKTKKLKYLIETNPQKELLMIGDNWSKDALIYSRIQKEFPNNTLDFYIRPIKKDKTIENGLKFNSAGEIRYSEKTKGRTLNHTTCQ